MVRYRAASSAQAQNATLHCAGSGPGSSRPRVLCMQLACVQKVHGSAKQFAIQTPSQLLPHLDHKALVLDLSQPLRLEQLPNRKHSAAPGCRLTPQRAVQPHGLQEQERWAGSSHAVSGSVGTNLAHRAMQPSPAGRCWVHRFLCLSNCTARPAFARSLATEAKPTEGSPTAASPAALPPHLACDDSWREARKLGVLVEDPGHLPGTGVHVWGWDVCKHTQSNTRTVK